MKFRILVNYKDADEDEDPWWETLEKDTNNPQEYAENVVEKFNATLRPRERPRKLLDVEVLDPDAIKDHAWVKTNLITRTGPGGSYDQVKCSRCEVTGKRYGLGGVTLDPKYRRSKVYHRCDTAQEHIKEHGHPKG